jgi:hypothetical protein
LQELLSEKLDQGDLTLKTKWRDFVMSVKDKEDERYLNMFNSTGYGESGNTLYFPLYFIFIFFTPHTAICIYAALNHCIEIQLLRAKIYVNFVCNVFSVPTKMKGKKKTIFATQNVLTRFSAVHIGSFFKKFPLIFFAPFFPFQVYPARIIL